MPAVGIEISSGDRPGTMGSYELPLSIGRADGPERAGIRHISLDPNNKNISRWHIYVTERGGRYYLTNKAANPGSTRYRGRPLNKDEQVEIRLGDVFNIYDHEIRVLPAGTIRLGFGDLARQDMHYYTLPSGGAILAHTKGRRFEIEELTAGAAYSPDRLRDRLALLFFYDESQPALAIVSNPKTAQILLNKALLGQNTVYLRPYEVIQVGENRVEVLPIKGRAVACSRADCRMLNEYDHDANCWQCGQLLVNADTVVVSR